MIRWSRRLRRGSLLVASLVVVAPALVPSAASARSAPQGWGANSSSQLAARPEYPTTITSTAGDVQGADALVSGHGGATLTYTGSGTEPSIIVDYGTEVGGLPFFEVADGSGSPTPSATYSESIQNGAPSTGSNADPSRTDTYTVAEPGLIVNPLVQGGERFESITLTSAGSLTLRRVRVSETTASQTEFSAGSFTSSSSELNEIWALGPNTLALDTLPSGVLPPVWHASRRGTEIPYSQTDLYQYGTSWSDYTMTFSGEVVQNQLSWVVLGGTTLILTASNDTLNTPNELLVEGGGGGPGGPPGPGGGPSGPMAYPLPAGMTITPGAFYTIQTATGSSGLSVSIDGQQVFTDPTKGTGSGSVGFQNAENAVALVKDLSVVSGGTTLYESPMTTAAAVTAFDAGTNPVSVIVDGGKRDRLVWGGDLLQAALSTFYTSTSADAVAGSLQLLGSYRTTSGEVSSADPPASALGTQPVNSLAGFGGYYSLVYSADWLLNVYNYYLYTGNLAFVRQEWPAVLAEMQYLHSNLDTNGLISTNSQDGMDWALDRNTGEATAYNAVYYKGLEDVSQMAAALGYTTLSAGWAQQAATVKSQINALLLDATTGVYDHSSAHTGTYAQDANSLAVLFGIAPASEASSIMANTNAALDQTTEGPHAFSDAAPGTGFGAITAVISPFMTAFQADALFSLGETSNALSLIGQVWGHMIPGQPYYSGDDWEALGYDGAPQQVTRTLAHAWGTGATSALSEYVLGVAPVTPGYSTWQIAPQFGSLTWARGTVPTPHGMIGVSWSKTSSFSLTVKVPGRTSGNVVLPSDLGSHVRVNGRPAQVTTSGNDLVIAISGGGRYTITVTS